MKKYWLFVWMLVSGCALIDAANGAGDDDVIKIDTNNQGNNQPNNVSNQPDDFMPQLCAWVQCTCGYDGCDPRTDCTPFPCFTCENASHCSTGDTCNAAGRCNSCETYYIDAPAFYTSPAGEDYICETNPFSESQICLLYECYPDLGP